MFKCNELIYIQLQKTGCTHIASLLSEVFDGQIVGKHNAATLEQLESIPYFISSIRNPWDWYLSLWTFGVQGKGALRHRLTRRNFQEPLLSVFKNPNQIYQICSDELSKDIKAWCSVYDEGDNVESFRQWLKLMHDEKHSRYLGEGYGNTAIANLVGFMTYRYLYLCCRNSEKLKVPGLIAGMHELTEFDKENCYIDYFIRQEALEDTLCEAIEKVRPVIGKMRELIFGSGKTNTSTRALSVSDYYDQESIDLVRNRDSLIIEKFGYSPPQ